MSATATDTRTVIVERDVPFPAKCWRALTQPHLLEPWLMKNDFRPGQAITSTSAPTEVPSSAGSSKSSRTGPCPTPTATTSGKPS
ncbi:MAG TPA: hypothetical protein VFL55_12145 [Acetobacteraceae bacterium]|nr:hypothetical protein [Acetobacteraceae bacterium]